MVWLFLPVTAAGSFVVGAVWEHCRRGGSADLADELGRRDYAARVSR